MPKEVYIHTKRTCKKNSPIGLLATEGTIMTGVYNKFFDKNYKLIHPNKLIQKNSVNQAIKLVKMEIENNSILPYSRSKNIAKLPGQFNFPIDNIAVFNKI